jgi:hypothetical protein
MKLLLINIVFFLTACGEKDEGDSELDDSVTDTGGDTVTPGCGVIDTLCFSFWGSNYSGQEEANCTANSDAQPAGSTPYEYFPEGCQDDAVAECTGLSGLDTSGQPVSGAEYTIYFYSGMDAATAQGNCTQNNGTYTEL